MIDNEKKAEVISGAYIMGESEPAKVEKPVLPPVEIKKPVEKKIEITDFMNKPKTEEKKEIRKEVPLTSKTVPAKPVSQAKPINNTSKKLEEYKKVVKASNVETTKKTNKPVVKKEISRSKTDNKKPILSIKGVSKYFKDRAAVDDVSFNIYEGEVFALIGPNGAGKSTLIKMITGLSKISHGQILISGKDITTDFERAAKNIGGIIENPVFYEYMRGVDNLRYYARLYENVCDAKIDEVVRLVGMEKRIKHKVSTYSLGMKQRVGIAQSILHSPKLLILDEPTNGLDPNGIREMREMLKKLAKDKKISILISSHILAEMELLCDVVGIIDNGRLIEVKDIKSLAKIQNKSEYAYLKVDYPNYAGKCIMDKFDIADVNVAGRNVIFKTYNAPVQEVTKMLIEEGLNIFGVNTTKKNLESIYMSLVSSKTSIR